MRNDQRNATLDSALRDAEERYVAANPHSRALDERAARFMPGREHAHGGSTSRRFRSPSAAAKGRGLWDLDGHVYKDFLGEYSAGLYGHSHPS